MSKVDKWYSEGDVISVSVESAIRILEIDAEGGGVLIRVTEDPKDPNWWD